MYLLSPPSVRVCVVFLCLFFALYLCNHLSLFALFWLCHYVCLCYNAVHFFSLRCMLYLVLSVRFLVYAFLSMSLFLCVCIFVFIYAYLSVCECILFVSILMPFSFYIVSLSPCPFVLTVPLPLFSPSFGDKYRKENVSNVFLPPPLPLFFPL